MALRVMFMSLAATAFVLFSPFSSYTSANIIPVGAGKVDVNFYYESLCQSYRSFITGDPQHLLDRNSGPIINLRLIPWGNARIVNGNFVCQYGPDECYLNTLQACAIHKWPDLRMHLDFIQCSENAYKDWTSCVTRETAQELQQCAKSNIGKNDIFNIMRYICDAYQGPNRPAACNTRTPADKGAYG